MIKFPIINTNIKNCKETSNEKFLFDENFALDGSELIPVDCGGTLVAPTVSVNELGKQLLRAASEGDSEETKSLLYRGALFTADWLGTSPLHLAARNNHLETCEILLKAGISRDARTKVDKTSLHIAACEGHVEVVETLLAHGSDPDCRDLLGMTPLHWAAQNGHEQVIEILIKHFAQTDVLNKFELTAADIASQTNRLDIVELINIDTSERVNTSEQLTLELISNDDSSLETSDHLNNFTSPIPLETILLEENENTLNSGSLHSPLSNEIRIDSFSNTTSFAESIKLLQEHGITMLPNDDSNILTTVMETGHTVVLTDVGKEVLKSTKCQQENNSTKPNKNIVKVTPEEFLSMTAPNLTDPKIFFKHNEKVLPKNMKRIVMKKNKIIPATSVNNISKISTLCGATDMETVMTQLIEARKTIEEYKVKLFKKEQEAEEYKQQLHVLMEDS